MAHPTTIFDCFQVEFPLSSHSGKNLTKNKDNDTAESTKQKLLEKRTTRMKWENNRKTSTVVSLPVFFLYIYKWKLRFSQQNWHSTADEKQNDYKFHGTLANCYSIELSTFCLVYTTHKAIQWAFKTALIAVIQVHVMLKQMKSKVCGFFPHSLSILTTAKSNDNVGNAICFTFFTSSTVTSAQPITIVVIMIFILLFRFCYRFGILCKTKKADIWSKLYMS